MKKIMNEPRDIIEEMLSGIVTSYPTIVHRVTDSRVIARNMASSQEEAAVTNLLTQDLLVMAC